MVTQAVPASMRFGRPESPGLNVGEYMNYFCYGILFSALATGTGNSFTDNEIKVSSEDFLIKRTSHWMSQENLIDVIVKYRDDSTGAYLTKSGTKLRMISSKSLAIDGSGTSLDYRAYQWPQPYRLKAISTLTVQAANTNGALAPNLYITFAGGKIYTDPSGRITIPPDKVPGVKKVPFTYMAARSKSTLNEGQVQVAANGSLQAYVSIDSDSDFMVTAISGDSTGECTIMLSEDATGGNWFNIPLHFNTIVGSGYCPNKLPVPRVISKKSTIGIQLVDLSGSTNNVYLAFHGYKLTR